jgi:hypothetical protein
MDTLTSLTASGAVTLLPFLHMCHSITTTTRRFASIAEYNHLIQDPVPGHSGHHLALVAPPREDGKIWSGVVTFTASKPVDVVVLHPYNKPQIVTTNQSFGEPLNAPNPFAPGQNIAITLMTKQTDTEY